MEENLKSHSATSVRLFIGLSLVILSGCAAIPTETGPVLTDIQTEKLTDSSDPAEMVRVASSFCSSTAPISKQLAAFQLVQEVFQKDRSNRPAALVLSKCALSASGLIDEEKRKAAIVQKGYEAARAADPEKKDPLVSYYRGCLLGLFIENKGLAAAGELSEFEEALATAQSRPQTDDGGPGRALGMYYLRAPAWPTGAGDLELSLEYLGRAAADYPGHPENHLFFAYALKEDGKPDEARRELELAEQALSRGEWGEYSSRWLKDIESFREELPGRH
ncbi:MAG: tetratricopeptide repeat protein [Candidatus Aureabacteria bacterium]|nr:tetratricopeptide repeat protein [Candidatus Auribacterota bacterium]